MLKKAFTLIEILIVVILLGILAAVVVPQFLDTADTARQSAADTTERMLKSQVELYRVRQGAEPTNLAAMAALDYIDSEDLNADGAIELDGYTATVEDGVVSVDAN